jgi:glycosyltransferase involved in cell wall biosynthesis
VWEGLPWNLTTLGIVREALQELRRHGRIALHLVTALERPFAFGDMGRLSTPAFARRLLGTNDLYLYEWNVQMLPALCAASDLAIIPIPREDPFMWAKPENKLLSFWRMGLPVVTSPTPAYSRVMKAAGLNLTCTTTKEWVETIGRLLDDEAARREAAERGRAFARLACDENTLLSRWDAVLADALKTSQP